MSETVVGHPDPTTITVRLPAGWTRAAMVGILAPLIGWVVPAAIAMMGFWSVADNPWLKERGWQEAVAIGSQFWALSVGSRADLAGLAVSLIPLLWTLGQIVVLRLLLSATRNAERHAAWAAVPTSVAVTLVLLAAIGTGANYGRATLVSLFIALVAAAWKIGGSRKTPWVNTAVRWSMLWLGATLLVAVVGLVIMTFRSWGQMSAATEALGATGLGAGIFGLMQFTYLPNLLFWGLAWTLGVGFTGVAGQTVSPQNPPTESIPLPLWDLVPTGASPLSWAALSLAVGLLLAVGMWWRWRRTPITVTAAQTLLGSGLLLVWVAVGCGLSRGGLGQDRLAHLGPHVGPVVGMVALLYVLPILVVVLGLHPQTLRWVWGHLRRGADTAQSWWGTESQPPRETLARRWGLKDTPEADPEGVPEPEGSADAPPPGPGRGGAPAGPNHFRGGAHD